MNNPSYNMTFEETLQKYSIPPSNKPISSNGFTRWGSEGRYWAKIVSQNVIIFGDWSQGINEVWQAKNENQHFSQQELKDKAYQVRKAREEAEIERQHYQEKIAVIALERWNNASSNNVQAHPYIIRKAIQPFGMRLESLNLLIPLYDVGGKLWTLQTIAQDGSKRFLPGGKKKACFHTLGLLKESNLLYVCEGFATGASIHMATGIPTIIAFDAYNLDPVIEVVKSAYPEKTIIICADNDQWKELNVGKEKAKAASANYNCQVVLPYFSPECLKIVQEKETNPTDFNDLHVLQGLDEVKNQLSNKYAAEEKPEEVFLRLSRLKPYEYDKISKEEAKRLGIKKSTLDIEVKYLRINLNQEKDRSIFFPEDQTWPEEVNLTNLLDGLAIIFKRYAVLPPHSDVALALWVVFTWCIDRMHTSPILAICSPEKQCGKTTLLSILGKLVFRFVPTSNISSAAVYRLIEDYQPTLIIDEADTFIKENIELRNILNAGHTRPMAFVIRSVGEEHEPRPFSTWGAKAIALIGKLPDTLHDRSIVIELRRKLKEEKTEKIRYADPQIFNDLRSQLKRFVLDAGNQLTLIRPKLPEDISDRAADNWEPLLAIATMAGENWLKKALAASKALSAFIQDAKSIGTQLLTDIKEIFESKNVDRISSVDLIKNLTKDEEKLWATFDKGKIITPRQLSKILRDYKITTKSTRLDDKQNLKAYERKQFEEAFSCYLSSISNPITVTPSQLNEEKDVSVSDVVEIPFPIRSLVTSDMADNLICDVVPDKGNQVEVEI
ncbi:MAG: DUF3631 domain-containing protein [Rhodospirillaceae bacterium]|nr:DUF3631 domain-containing protein [Rhodospirillaceae bacterium]